MEAIYYSEKSIAIYGNTEPWKGNLQSLGGLFNRNLRGQPGWIMSRKKEQQIMEFVAQANAGAIEPREFVPRSAAAPKPTSDPQVQAIDSGSNAMTAEQALARLRASQTSQESRVSRSSPIPMAGPRTLQLNIVPSEDRQASCRSQEPVSAVAIGSLVPLPNGELPTRQAIAPVFTAENSRSRITPVTSGPRQAQVVTFPNTFVAGDGLTYQVAIYTVPLPTLNQRVIYVSSAENESVFTVTSVQNEFPVDAIRLSHGNVVVTAVLNRGQWQLDQVITGEFAIATDHQLTFLSLDTPVISTETPMAPISPPVIESEVESIMPSRVPTILASPVSTPVSVTESAVPRVPVIPTILAPPLPTPIASPMIEPEVESVAPPRMPVIPAILSAPSFSNLSITTVPKIPLMPAIPMPK